MLAVEHLLKRYGSLTVLDGVDLTLARGETLALTGESGSGKSTLLHLIAGLDQADAGHITLGDARVTGMSDAERAHLRRDKVGLVFQQFNLIQSLTVAQNVAMQARLAGRWDPAAGERLMADLGLGDLAPRYPEQLSGGQQQRVAIARAVAAGPQLLLADEPTGNLDQATGDAVLDVLMSHVAETGTALILVTHSDRVAARAGRTLHLAAGQLS
ncbi:MAG: ABC transporter ATP-binding protein [Pseudomonadota bacterium]